MKYILVILVLFIFFDFGVYFGTPKLIRDEWPWQKLIPGGAIFYKIIPPNKQMNAN